MKGSDGNAGDDPPAAQTRFQTPAHFSGGLVGKSHGGNLIRPDASLLDQVRDSGDQGSGLAGAGAGDDGDGGIRGRNRRLCGIEGAALRLNGYLSGSRGFLLPRPSYHGLLARRAGIEQQGLTAELFDFSGSQ